MAGVGGWGRGERVTGRRRAVRGCPRDEHFSVTRSASIPSPDGVGLSSDDFPGSWGAFAGLD